MEIYIDNKNLDTFYGIKCLDYTDAFSIAAERTNERTWMDKSGVDKNTGNARYDSKDFQLQCYCKASSMMEAYAKAKTLTDYMFSKGCFVLSFRDELTNLRTAILTQRSGVLSADINIRQQNSLYVFKLGLQDVNPNAVKYYTSIMYNSSTHLFEASISYTKGRTAKMYWGDGQQVVVSNSGTYKRTDFTEARLLEVIIDIDDNSSVVSPITANFTADSTEGIKDHAVQFTDTSTGNISIWSWSFGDGKTSAEQNPQHTYTAAGTYTVTLQIFNVENGTSTISKVDYIVVRHARLLINSTNTFKINSTNKLLKN